MAVLLPFVAPVQSSIQGAHVRIRVAVLVHLYAEELFLVLVLNYLPTNDVHYLEHACYSLAFLQIVEYHGLDRGNKSALFLRREFDRTSLGVSGHIQHTSCCTGRDNVLWRRQ